MILAEAEFESDEQSGALEIPVFIDAEVTADVRFTGWKLARTSRNELASLLRETTGL